MANRNVSIDSTVSSMSTSTSTSARPQGADSYRVPHDNSGPQNIASLVAAAGSTEAALEKVFAEKQQAASHNAQLWRLVEKQRAMILGLNKDLEKSLKEKERYRRKLKDHLAQSNSAPAMLEPSPSVPDSASTRDTESQASMQRPGEAAAKPLSMKDMSSDLRKTSDASDAGSPPLGRSDTPQDAPIPLSAFPQPANSGVIAATSELERVNGATSASGEAAAMSKPALVVRSKVPAVTPPVSSKTVEVTSRTMPSPTGMSRPSGPVSPSQAGLSPTAATSTSGLKTRKAPPAPLKLSRQADIAVTNNIIDASDSDYEEDPESARGEYLERGRRKTREEDDRDREAQARQELEHRSQSKKDKKSKSQPPTQDAEAPMSVVQPLGSPNETPKPTGPFRSKAQVYQPTGTPTDASFRTRAASDVANQPQRNHLGPSIMSPGLPMSPRPGDRPLNSPMPRAPMNSIPMSPKSGMPLSPRAPRQPIPLPPDTSLPIASPHLDRAKAYHQIQNLPIPTTSVPAERVKPSPSSSPDDDRPSTSSISIDQYPISDVFRGFVTDQYPDLLLPPNALPSIYVKTASSRMRPSRLSYIAPKPGDENPVFTLAVYERSQLKQLWRVEKTLNSLATLDQQIKSVGKIRERLPEKTLFTGHAPAKIDARRMALDSYFAALLDSIVDEKGALIFCHFISTDAIGIEDGESFSSSSDNRADTPINKLRTSRAGYLTKRGKNFGGWKARFFVLDGPTLKYFEGPGGAQLGLVKLQNAQIGKQSNTLQNLQEEEDNQFRHAFLILEPKKKDSSSLVRHVLCAESDEERDAWVDALLQYVDSKDDDDQQAVRQGQITKADISGPTSPRFQRSMNDLRPLPSQIQGPPMQPADSVQALSYTDTVAGEAPIMGPPLSPRFNHTPPPPYEKMNNHSGEQPNPAHPVISGPTNLQVIQNAGDWGMRPPPTPTSRDGKKRGVFQLIRPSRPSTESANEKVFSTPPDRSPGGSRPVFGVPLAEAVEYAHPVDITTELPAVVYRCIEYLMARNAIAEEGIFRLSGSSTVIKSLKERFNTEGDVNLLAEGTYYDVHAVASLLKLYLRELPTSILTRDLHLEFLDCVGLAGEEKVRALNALVNRLPTANRALLQALSSFLLAIVNNVGVNKMSVRNRKFLGLSILFTWNSFRLLTIFFLTVGVVFSPTLNLPGPLISLFVEEQDRIFGRPLELDDFPHAPVQQQDVSTTRGGGRPSIELRSPRKQMFSDLPTPAYNQTQFQSLGGSGSGPYGADDTGMIPVHPQYASYQMAPQGEGGFGSLNDALRSPTVYNTVGTGAPTPRDMMKPTRRESSLLQPGSNHNNMSSGPLKKSSMTRLRKPEEGASF